jgi:protein SCO1/2
MKCSLTVTKLARVQQLLETRNLGGRIYTAAITYDPAFDRPDRLRGYAVHRNVRLGECHRMLRATSEFDVLRRHFDLGVNFIESIVNRHKVELYILDREGRIAASFERFQWDETEVVNRAVEVLTETSVKNVHIASSALGTLSSIALAFFPKCPVCWSAYLSVFGVASLEQLPYSSWLQPALVIAMVINLGSVWFRARAAGRMLAFHLAAIGGILIALSKLEWSPESAGALGMVLTVAGTLLSVVAVRNYEDTFKRVPSPSGRGWPKAG